jgi:hypothetical protein
MTRIPLILSLFCTLLLPGLSLAQTTWVVDPAGGGNFTTIQAALGDTRVINGDQVLVLAGTYVENINTLGKSILLKSESGALQTIVDGNASGSVMLFESSEGPSTIIDGFTLQNGMAWDGGGVFITENAQTGVSASPTIRNCIIENNMGNGGGGGIAIRGGSPEFTNCLVRNNQTLHYNGAGMVLFNASPTILNCTFEGNAAGGHGGGIGIWDNNCQPQIHDSIFWGNTPDNIRLYGGPTNIDAYYSCIEFGANEFWFRTGCIDTDPFFATGTDGVSYLSQMNSGQSIDSPCVDTADPMTSAPGTTRTDGLKDSGIADMGFHFAVPPATLKVTNLTAGQTALVEIRNATPNNFAHFAWSIYGSGPVSTPLGDAMVSPPFNMFLLHTDANGYASMAASIPAWAAGIPVWCHGSDYGALALLNPLALVIQ